MHPVLLLLIGVAIVLGGILLLRLHPFLSLTLAALAVGSLTPQISREQYLAEQKAIPYTVQGQALRLSAGPRDAAGDRVLVVQRREGMLAATGEFQLDRVSDGMAEADGAADLLPSADPPALLLRPLDFAAVQSAASQNVGERVGGAFGSTCGKIGILIALAAIIGMCMLESGAADRIVRAALSLVGERGAPLAFLGSGFLLGIPVFFDTVFYLMMPLGKAMRLRTGRSYLVYVLTIVAGATMAHSLVPPTPGPLLVAGELNVDVGLLILAGCAVGLVTALSGYAFAVVVSRFTDVPLRESPDFSLQQMEEVAKRSVSELPPLWLSVLPILLPVVLIAGNTLRNTIEQSSGSPLVGDPLAGWLDTLGNKNIALALAAFFAIVTVVRTRRPSRGQLADSMQKALSSGGVIILITAAGGAFGATLQQTGIVALIERMPQGSPAVVLTLAFLITTAIRTAQGSATVAMITAVGVLGGFSDPSILGCHPVYLALAIGCGSKPIAWMNDSGFWVICKMSSMTEAEGLRFVTPMSVLMGVTGLAVVLISSAPWPGV